MATQRDDNGRFISAEEAAQRAEAAADAALQHADEAAAHAQAVAAPAAEAPAKLLKTPDITTAQILGMIPLVAEAGHAFGAFTLSQPQQDSLTKLVAGGLALFGADAIVRLGRALGNARK